MNEYRIQRLKEDLTYAQHRNKHQKQQLANYKNVHEKDLKEIERLNNIIKRFEVDLRDMYLTFGEFSEEYTENRIKELKGKNNEEN